MLSIPITQVVNADRKAHFPLLAWIEPHYFLTNALVSVCTCNAPAGSGPWRPTDIELTYEPTVERPNEINIAQQKQPDAARGHYGPNVVGVDF